MGAIIQSEGTEGRHKMDKNIFGERVRERRQQLGMSQEELAKRLGYTSRSTINKIENGTNDVVQTKVIDFANALDTSIAYLMAWDKSEVFRNELLPEANATEKEVIKSLRKADKLTKQMVLQLLKMDVNRADELR